MPFVRDPVPHSNDIRALRSFLERTFSALDLWAQQIETTVNELVRLRQIDGLEVRYQWDDSSTDISVPVPAGFIKCDAALPENATEYAVSRTDEFGRLALTGSLQFFEEGFFEVRNFTRDTFYLYSMDAAATQRATDITFPVTIIDSAAGAPPQQDDTVQAQFWPAELLATAKNI